MAEFILKHLCHKNGLRDTFQIDSAAVSTEEIGNDIYPPAKRKLREKGIPFDFHAARLITQRDYLDYDYIICADHSNLRWLSRIIGEDSMHKVSLMMDWINENRDVADPWYTGDFESAYQDILSCCEAILSRLCSK